MKLDIPLVLATRNEGKVSEFDALLSGLGCEIKSLRDFGPIPPVEEKGESFEDNAVEKARFTSRVLGFPCLADDSGLVVDALGGLPGVRSARYAGDGASDEENWRKLLKAMEGVRERAARFECVIAISVPTGPTLIYEGRCEGLIAEAPSGTGGFGYDPVFFYPPLGKTFGEMSPEEKNRISHRGRAMAELRAEFAKVLVWLKQRLTEASYGRKF